MNRVNGGKKDRGEEHEIKPVQWGRDEGVVRPGKNIQKKKRAKDEHDDLASIDDEQIDDGIRLVADQKQNDKKVGFILNHRIEVHRDETGD